MGAINSVKIVRDKQNDNKSCGFGFIEFKDENGVKNSLKRLQNYLLAGHCLQLSVSK